jgi:hypothetical protein
MTHYIVLQTIKTHEGGTILNDGDKLKSIAQHRGLDCFGIDHRNLFWTDDFLDSKPRLFQRINMPSGN